MEQLKIRNWQIAQAMRKAQEKYKALAAAEAEMDKARCYKKTIKT